MKDLYRSFGFLIAVLLFSTCIKDEHVVLEPNMDMTIFPNVKVLGQPDFESHVLSIDSTDFTLTVSENLINQYDISQGDVLVNGMGQGLLRKVEFINHTSDNVLIHTSQATFEDALEQGSIMHRQTLEPSMIESVAYHYEGVQLSPSTFERDNRSFDFDFNVDFGYSVNLTGDMSLYSDIIFELEVRRLLRLTKVHFGYENNVNANIELTAGGSFEFNPQFNVATVYFTPIIIPTIIPIVITPILEVNVGIDGRAEASLSTSLDYLFEYQTGVIFERGEGWYTYSESDTDIQYSPPTLTMEASVAAYVQPEIAMLLYGVLGAYVDSRAYSEVEVTPLDTPWWNWYAGYRVGMGARARILSVELFDVSYPELLANKWLIASSYGEPPPGHTGSVSGPVRDAVTLNGIANVNVGAYQGQSFIDATTTDNDGEYTLVLPSGETYRLEFSKPGYISVDYNNVEVVTDQDIFLEAVLQIDETYAGLGTVSGKIQDAVIGHGISGAEIYVRAGMNNQDGSIITNVTSGTNGDYSIANLEAGNYTIEVQKSEYMTAFSSVISIGGQTTPNQNVTLTPEMDEDEIRIILDWGLTPPDLDSHLTGPIPNSSDRFHVFFPLSNRQFIHNGIVYVALDYDVTNSYGPETITIYQQTSGMYRYSVHDYTNRTSTTSTQLSNSTARVRVYFGSNLVQTFNVPSNTPGTLWTVFELEGSNITPINSMAFESSPGNVTKGTDAKLIQMLPPK